MAPVEERGLKEELPLGKKETSHSGGGRSSPEKGFAHHVQKGEGRLVPI